MKAIIYLRELVDSVTMYRLTLYGLIGLSAITILFSLTGRAPYTAEAQIASLVILAASGFIANKSIATLKSAPVNTESWLITSLILYLILPPLSSIQDAGLLILVAVCAMASKFLLTYHRKNLLNPAAFGAALFVPATWWIGSSIMLPFTALFAGVLLLKLRLYQLFLAFTGTALAASIVMSLIQNVSIIDLVYMSVLSSPLVFLGSVMLTEPSTLPPTRNKKLIYGALVGLLIAVHPRLAGISLTPELALLIGNIFAFIVGNRHRIKMKLVNKHQLSPDTYDFVFSPERPFRYEPGQYMEWTIPHFPTDGRGNRRSFSLASSPTEANIRIGVKFYEPSSSFKKALLHLQRGDTVFAGQLAGDFTLAKDHDQKMLFIAGGIGITPIRSMLKYLIDSNSLSSQDITVLYLNHAPNQLAYQDIITEAKARGVKIISSTSSSAVTQLPALIPDLRERVVYISGPSKMVERFKFVLRELKVKHIKTDYFSGY